MAKQTPIPCVLMRGGTSKGPYFDLADLPEDEETRNNVLLAAMGSPDVRQIDGIGGADSLTSKVAMVSKSERDGIDIDYLFAQVSIEKAFVDTNPSCGNMLSGIAPYALEKGWVPIEGETSEVTIYNVNTDSVIEAVIQTPEGAVNYDGDAAIDGVPGTAAPILLKFMAVAGSKTGKLLPTGHPKEEIDGIEMTCMDVAMPMVLMRAADLGITGHETRDELDANTALFERMEPIRREAGRRMGLGDVSELVIPKIGLLSEPVDDGSITSRYFVPTSCHAAHAVTGGLCVATCAVMEGTVADGLSRVNRTAEETIVIEHPSGQLNIELCVDGHGPDLTFVYGGVLRTARWLFEGNVFVPSDVWAG
ncbi:MAG: 4-oxalomesaconate tautomerase [Rhodospirillaceae bacterium]